MFNLSVIKKIDESCLIQDHGKHVKEALYFRRMIKKIGIQIGV